MNYSEEELRNINKIPVVKNVGDTPGYNPFYSSPANPNYIGIVNKARTLGTPESEYEPKVPLTLLQTFTKPIKDLIGYISKGQPPTRSVNTKATDDERHGRTIIENVLDKKIPISLALILVIYFSYKLFRSGKTWVSTRL